MYNFPPSVRWSHRSSSWSGGAVATWMLRPGPVRSCSLLRHVKAPLTTPLRSPSAWVDPPPEKLPPQHHPSSPPLLHPSLPFSRQPPWLSTKWAACQIEEGFTLPLWIREWVHSTVMQWKLNPPASLQCRCWIDTYVTWVWLCTILSFLRFSWSCLSLLSHKNASQFVKFSV